MTDSIISKLHVQFYSTNLLRMQKLSDFAKIRHVRSSFLNTDCTVLTHFNLRTNKM